jgi:ketosteroid isomerase-like protein
MTRCVILFLMAITIPTFIIPERATADQIPKESAEQSRKEVLKVSEEIDQAMWRKDIAAMGRHISDTLDYTNQFGTLFSKAQWLENVRTGALTIRYLKHDVVRIHVYGDSAVLIGISHATFVLNGKTSDTPRRFTRLFVKQAGEWLLVGQHFSAIEKP